MRDTSSTRPSAGRSLAPPLRAWRLLRLALHLTAGAARVAVIYPALDPSRRQAARRRWSRRMLEILGLRLETGGAAIEPASLLVANHISWIDVFVINALRPAAFVSKAEVRRWPLIGWLAARNDTLFLQRGSRRHAHAMSEAVGAVLRDGGNVAIFPEGTTTDGRGVRNFHGALLQPAIDAGRPVQPLALRYRTPSGAYCAAPAYVGDTSLWQCVKAMLAQPHTVAAVHVGAPLDSAAIPRRALAQMAQEAIAARVAEAGRSDAHQLDDQSASSSHDSDVACAPIEARL